MFDETTFRFCKVYAWFLRFISAGGKMQVKMAVDLLLSLKPILQLMTDAASGTTFLF